MNLQRLTTSLKTVDLLISQTSLQISVLLEALTKSKVIMQMHSLTTKNLQIRKAIGLDKTHGYATILFLTSIVEHKLGDSCKAAENVKKVISIYNYLGMLDDASVAEAEGLKEFKSACANLVSQN